MGSWRRISTLLVSALACWSGILVESTRMDRSPSSAASKEYRKPPPEFPHHGSEFLINKLDALNSGEPSCEELRAMWRFSKRQSRASEITNEIPSYRDPFAYNVWAPYYPTTRSSAGIARNFRFSEYRRPVYGRVVHSPPFNTAGMDRTTSDDLTGRYGALQRHEPPRRRLPAFRLPGGGIAASQNALSPVAGSFQRLKELIRTERARELQAQRAAEEVAARAATLKEIANGNSFSAQSHYDPEGMEQRRRLQEQEQDSFEQEQGQEQFSGEGSQAMFTFPDLLAPPSGYRRASAYAPRPLYDFQNYGARMSGVQD